MDKSIAEDALWGRQAIADFIGRSLRQTTWLVESGQIPVGRIGKHVVGSRTTLRDHFSRVSRGAARSEEDSD